MTRFRVFLPAILVLIVGCAGTSQDLGKTEVAQGGGTLSTPGEQEYHLRAGDEIEIKFHYNPELNNLVTIRPDGKISLETIDEVTAAGLTPSQLDAELTRRYSDTIIDPEITVIVRRFSGQKVFVGGEVNRPGLITYEGKLTLLGAIFQAGGPRDTAKLSQVLIIRNSDTGGLSMHDIDLREAATEDGINTNIYLQPYDIVFIPKSRVAKIGEFFDRYFNGLIPLATISGFGWMYRLITLGF